MEGFYLPSLRICSFKFLNELDSIESSFAPPQYPNFFIQCAKIKSFKIQKQKCYTNNSNSDLPHRFIILSTNSTTHIIVKKQ